MRQVWRWWPVPVLIVMSVGAQKALLESKYEVAGHAAEHLSSATAPFAAAAVVGTLLLTTRGALRRPVVLAALVAWFVATILVMVGNIRVIDALVAAGEGRTPTTELSESTTVETAHGLANSAPWFGVVASLALIVAFWRYRYVSWRVALGAAVLSVIFPPWIIAGAGVLVITIARCIAYARE